MKDETEIHCRPHRVNTLYYFSDPEHPGRDVAFLFLEIVDVSNYSPPFNDAHRGCHRVYPRKSNEKRTKTGPNVTSTIDVFNRVFQAVRDFGENRFRVRIRFVCRRTLANILIGWFLTPVIACFIAVTLYVIVNLRYMPQG